jgi:lysozyme
MADISQRGIDFIVGFEGKKTLLPDGRYKSYLDTLAHPNVWTIWAGLTKGVGKDTVWTVEECERHFRRELTLYEDAIERLVKVPLNQNQFDALTSFVYNCGIGALQKSTLLKVLNAGKYAEVPGQLARWNKAGGKVWKGLVRRRAAEGALFMEPMAIGARPAVEEGDEPDAEIAMPQRVEETKAPITEAAKSPTIWSTLVGLLSSIWVWLGSVASDTTTEVVAKKQSLTGFEAIWSHFGVSLGGVLLVVTIACLGVVLVRHLTRYSEGRA